MKTPFGFLLLICAACSIVYAGWEQYGGPSGANCFTVTTHKGRYFVGTVTAGIFMSEDTGKTWSRASNGIPSSYVIDELLSMDSSLLVVVSRTVSSGLYFFFRSYNEGRNWVAVQNGLPDTLRGYSGINVCLNSCFLANDSLGVFRLQEGSDRWECTSAGLPANKKWLDFTGVFGRVYTATDSLLFWSNDTGRNWFESKISFPKKIMCLGSSGSSLLLGFFSDGVRYSSDTGNTWYRILSIPTYIISRLITSDLKVWALSLGINTYEAQNGTTSFTPIGIDIRDAASIGNSCIAFRSDDTYYNWKRTPLGFPLDAAITSLAYFNNNLFIATADGTFRFDERTNRFVLMNPLIEPDTLYQLSSSNQEIFARSLHSLFRYDESSESWMRLGNSIFDSIQIANLQCMGSSIFINTSKGIFESVDDGVNWNCLSLQIPGNSVIFTSIPNANIVAYDAGNPHRIYRFTPAGQWEEVPVIVPDSAKNIQTLVSNDSALFLSTERDTFTSGGFHGIIGNVYISSDGGSTWNKSSIKFPYISAIQSISTVKNYCFARALSANTYREIFISYDYGKTWQSESSLPGDQIACEVGSQKLYAGTMSFNSDPNHGLWIRNLSEITTAKPFLAGKMLYAASAPRVKYRGGRIHITYGFFVASTLPRLELFNLQGRLLKTTPTMRTSSSYTIIYDLPRSISGALFYKITIGKNSYRGTFLIVN
jgi:photosystem II stability/assembly factor-like uncharacterized protein